MYAKLNGATLHGIDGCIITVEVDISQGLPSLISLDYLINLLKRLVNGYERPLKIVDTNFQ